MLLPSKSCPKPMFTIHLIENEDGKVSVIAEMVGAGPNAINIGIEIMQKLEMASWDHPEKLLVQPITYCKNYQ